MRRQRLRQRGEAHQIVARNGNFCGRPGRSSYDFGRHCCGSCSLLYFGSSVGIDRSQSRATLSFTATARSSGIGIWVCNGSSFNGFFLLTTFFCRSNVIFLIVGHIFILLLFLATSSRLAIISALGLLCIPFILLFSFFFIGHGGNRIRKRRGSGLLVLLYFTLLLGRCTSFFTRLLRCGFANLVDFCWSNLCRFLILLACRFSWSSHCIVKFLLLTSSALTSRFGLYFAHFSRLFFRCCGIDVCLLVASFAFGTAYSCCLRRTITKVLQQLFYFSLDDFGLASEFSFDGVHHSFSHDCC
eukprot:04163.XXX_149790_150686_1 [CDS] Oithona nana genome sequencing.